MNVIRRPIWKLGKIENWQLFMPTLRVGTWWSRMGMNMILGYFSEKLLSWICYAIMTTFHGKFLKGHWSDIWSCSNVHCTIRISVWMNFENVVCAHPKHLLLCTTNKTNKALPTGIQEATLLFADCNAAYGWWVLQRTIDWDCFTFDFSRCAHYVTDFDGWFPRA